ncbi:MAG: 2-C-methyl-D-erythritol 4-phosphate cytidylyltransferase [Bacteroidota bacterium]
MQKAAVIVAGGRGTRMGSSTPKQFLPLSGIPILVRTLKAFLEWDEKMLVALVLPEAFLMDWYKLSSQYLRTDEASRIFLAKGGASRTESVEAGLHLLAKEIENSAACLVAIHDGVRPFIFEKVLHAAYQMAETAGAAVVCVPVKASLRRQQEDGGSEAVDRSEYWEVQTPQIFYLAQILDAFARRPHNQFTDDASLYQAMGGRISICEGSYDNIKVTTPGDMFVAEEILKRNQT